MHNKLEDHDSRIGDNRFVLGPPPRLIGHASNNHAEQYWCNTQTSHRLVHTNPSAGQENNPGSQHLLLGAGTLADNRFQFFFLFVVHFEWQNGESSKVFGIGIARRAKNPLKLFGCGIKRSGKYLLGYFFC
jgi:hypothetical protein